MACKHLRFRLVYDNNEKPNPHLAYAEYSIEDFQEVVLAEWAKIQGAGDRVQVIKRALERACEIFKRNAVAMSAQEE